MRQQTASAGELFKYPYFIHNLIHILSVLQIRRDMSSTLCYNFGDAWGDNQMAQQVLGRGCLLVDMFLFLVIPSRAPSEIRIKQKYTSLSTLLVSRYQVTDE